MATRASSASSTDRAPEVPGFRVGPLLARDALGALHEATQLGLDRRVALRLLDDAPGLGERLRRLRWPEHERATDLYAAGARPGGFFVARQLVEGPALSALSPRRRRAVLRDIAAALDAAHAEGIVHGAVGPHTVWVDGDRRGVLADFGLGDGSASADDDRAALAALVAAQRARPRRAPAVAVAVVLAVAAGALAARGGGRDEPPAVLPGAQVLGSALQPAAQGETIDCEGRAPSGASPACTLVQTQLPGRPLAARRAGVIRRWRVRDARGELALTVLRRRGGTFEVVTRAEPVRVENEAAIDVALPVAAGDVVGVELTPGAGVGVRRAVSGAAMARWIGPLTIEPRAPDRDGAIGGELLLRVEVEPGATARPPGLLEGRAAATAPAGREVDRRQIDLPSGEVRAAAVVLTAGRVVVDLFASGRRLVRLPVIGADPRGQLEGLETLGLPLLLVRWSNPDGRVVRREYVVLSDELRVRR